MLFQPRRPDRYLWDTWILPHEGQYHLFFLQKVAGELKSTAVAHAVSDDLVRWRETEPALLPGPPGAWDSGPLRTGVTVAHDGRFYLFYGSAIGDVDRIGVATSTDLARWERHPGNPISVPDPRWYEADAATCPLDNVAWRDPCVIPEADGFIGYVCARARSGPVGGRGTVATLRSRDLLHWEAGPPLDVPGTFACMEVPDIFELNGRWFLLHSTGPGFGTRLETCEPALTAGTHVLWAERRDGPYTKPPRDIILGSPAGRMTAYVARTVATPMGRIAYYHNVYPRSATTRGPRGSFGLPKGLATDERGLKFTYLPLLDPYRREQILPRPTGRDDDGQRERSGDWSVAGDRVTGRVEVGTSALAFGATVRDVEVTTSIALDCRAAGIGLSMNEHGHGIGVVFDRRAGTVAVANLRRAHYGVAWTPLAERHAPIESDRRVVARVVAINDAVEVFVDDELMLSVVFEDRSAGDLWLFADDGRVRFSDLKAWRVDVS